MVAPMDITFLGTGSAQPSATRNHQSIALRSNGDIWLFDAGEATQHQLQKSDLKMSRISAVFITHMHGDHCFGLPPLLCTMSENLNPNRTQHESPIEVYGPRPLRHWLRTALKSTYSRLGRHYRVHELLMDGDEAARDDSSYDLHPDELPGSNVYMQNSRFTIPIRRPDGTHWTVLAAPILHSIPSLGYLVREPDVPGKLDPNTVKPMIERNADALRQMGYKSPMAILGQLQRKDEPITLPDGSILEPPGRRPGRELVILGDTYDPSSMIDLCSDAPDILIHEATNALTRLDIEGAREPPTFEEVEQRAREHGHSTPQMAAAFAKKIRAKKLLMTHFSSRYKGNEEGADVMEEIRQLAVKELGSDRDGDVFCARDLWRFEVKLPS